MIKVGDKSIPWREDLTISELLIELGDKKFYPVVRINHRYVPNSKFEQTYIPDNSNLFLIPMVAGG